MGIVSVNARRIMREKCIMQSLLARKLGLHPKTFNAMMTGRKLIREEHIQALSLALEVMPGELFIQRDDDTSPDTA